MRRGDAELAAIMRRFIRSIDDNYVATNGPSTDGVLILDGHVALRGEDEFQAVMEAVGDEDDE